MSWEGMTPEAMIAAQQQIDKFGQRAQEIFAELQVCYTSNDHVRGGILVREMWEEPELLILVIGLLTSSLVDSRNGPLARPEEIGVEQQDINPEVWEIGALDQMEAAAEAHDVSGFARIALDAQIRAYAADMRRVVAAGGQPPDVETLMRGYMIMDQTSVVAVAAEALRRLVLQEVSKDDRG